MNILPKKNWHVRKKENIARVRKDEAEAAEKEKENERRIKLAEQEARVAFMRKRARERDGKDPEELPEPTKKETKIEADIFTSAGNINFFKEAEMGDAKTGTNKEYEEEKKEEKESYEKKIGLLTYLGQDTREATGTTDWFAQRDHVVSKISDSAEEIGLKTKVKLDPLGEIMKHTDFKVYPKIEKTSPDINLPPSSELICKPKSKNLCRKDKKHKREKHKKRKRKHSDSETEGRKKKKKKHSSKKSKSKKRKYSSSVEDEDDDEEEEKRKRLVKLREERIKREAKERKREERLVAGKNPDEEEKPKTDLPFKQKYNSQFNPHLAKQNQELSLNQPPALQSGVKYWLK